MAATQDDALRRHFFPYSSGSNSNQKRELFDTKSTPAYTNTNDTLHLANHHYRLDSRNYYCRYYYNYAHGAKRKGLHKS